MSLKSKAKAAQKRLVAAKQRQAEVAKLDANWQRLTTMTTSFSKSAGKAAPIDLEANKPFRRATPHYPSLMTTPVKPGASKPILTPEMQAREDAAQLEIARKRKRVAILVNKSSYQYITEETDLTTLGRK